ncbi:uncharacterized protein LOC134838450 isoform X2 [Culicoides brevitarsis]|uniref:uncharacterized protein LOC134838450 isoform X2 n=1 Tax=Culicoides brevitarsis TaxID=469753 RepID=UPI00307C6ED9
MSEPPSKKQKTFHKIDFESLHVQNFKEQKHCDVTFWCKNTDGDLRKIGAHKMMLVLVSDVFETMFYGKTAENDVVTKSEEVLIDDITIDTFTDFLSDVKFENSIEICRFYYAAHKYNCKEALKFIHEAALDRLDLTNCLVFYETALLHDDCSLKDAALKKIQEDISAVIISTEFLTANPESVNLIFQSEHLSINSEMELVWALQRYIDHNQERDPKIALKVRPALQIIRFLTLRENDIRQTSLLSDDEKKAIIECLKDSSLDSDSNLAGMPDGFSISRSKRISKIHILSKIFKGYSFRCINPCHYTSYSNHSSWNCCNLSVSVRNKIKEIFEKYEHTNIVLYSNDDLISLYEAYTEGGLVKS